MVPTAAWSESNDDRNDAKSDFAAVVDSNDWMAGRNH
jgi:hypothetical protein